MLEPELLSVEENIEVEMNGIRPGDIDTSELPKGLLGSCEYEDFAWCYIRMCQQTNSWEISLAEFVKSIEEDSQVNPNIMRKLGEFLSEKEREDNMVIKAETIEERGKRGFLSAWMEEPSEGQIKAVPLLIELYHKKYPREEEEQREIVGVITAKGSFYRYNPDGTTQRYKTIEQKEYEPQTAIVFVPDYETIRKLAPSSFDVDTVLGKNGVQYKQSLLENIYREGSPNYIVNAQGTKLDTKEEIERETEQIFLTFGSDGEVDFSLPVSTRPKIGYYTFDTRRYYDPQVGEWKREKHLGNKVIEIRYK